MTGQGEQLLHQLKMTIDKRLTEQRPVVIGVTGNVASGKTTFAKRLQEFFQSQWPSCGTYLVSTDNFLMPNQRLRQANLFDRKGFPETYDGQQMQAFCTALAMNDLEIAIPVYDHSIDDINVHRHLLIDHPNIIILEGLMVLQPIFRALLDQSIFLEVPQSINYQWYLARCLRLNLPAIYHLEGAAFEKLAHDTWINVNLRNYLDNVEPLQGQADIVVSLGEQHEVVQLTVRHSLQFNTESPLFAVN
ncbi:MAG: hypothetical protein LKG79_00505 [Furfurilactobacillus sp.]|uniref:Phosphoribulokinase/uridine kinase domain-containing protein n=1 Tax=Furfurilactobacillus milii TaxID=2888272 RepID=A0ABT6D8V8_9LACO|nr:MULTISPECIES: hypothetical protein [Furfurilactobacillus]QLE66299.1 Pantothenate kinase [Furfurilactobacillus rossiae]MCF6159755.1 hypothetical protein [Furfurilactobacillus milii]MCF6163160.1 hypothetical protein [Furfurilactobacillus milii]MCF6419136.1 hypothetical protein [Furfurilactobacillus milii]MCH4010989.1 hypothetical protein [Furfurilactobacillus sp.]